MNNFFENQLNKNKPLTEEAYENIKTKKYHSGRDIKIGEKILLAILIDEKNKRVENQQSNLKLIKIHPDEVELYELVFIFDKFSDVPIVRIKE